MRRRSATRYAVSDGVQTFAEPVTTLGSFMVLVVGELHSRASKPYREWFTWARKPHLEAGSTEAQP